MINSHSINPKHAKAHMRLGYILYQAGDLEKSRYNLERSITMISTIPETHLYLGRVFLDLGRPEDAVRELQNALRLNPVLVDVHQDLGKAYRELGYEDEAVAEFKIYREATGLEANP